MKWGFGGRGSVDRVERVNTKLRGGRAITEDVVDEAGLLSMYVKGVAVLRL